MPARGEPLGHSEIRRGGVLPPWGYGTHRQEIGRCPPPTLVTGLTFGLMRVEQSSRGSRAEVVGWQKRIKRSPVRGETGLLGFRLGGTVMGEGKPHQ
jgi:hypothetical protein